VLMFFQEPRADGPGVVSGSLLTYAALGLGVAVTLVLGVAPQPLLDLAKPYLLTGGGHRYAAGLTFQMKNLRFVQATLNQGALEQAQGAPTAALPVDGEGTRLVPAAAELERLEPFGQGFPEPVLRVAGQVQGPVKTFGDGYRKFRLQGEREEFTLFNEEPRSLEGALSLAVSPQDHPRWGRSWRVDGVVADGEAR